ncbi:hypothetical protein OUZ56_004840 [Daphnia magna]|uniref:Uncharacterized protein n=1 Tax=Daphnia magna TaxID=35525 RepID=A0ABQ9YR67_9CRUS|nr:hypothetical protein OUZ56_004840 [Daphnia magna]
MTLPSRIQLTLKTSISSVVTCDLAVKLYRKTKTVNSLLWGLQIIHGVQWKQCNKFSIGDEGNRVTDKQLVTMNTEEESSSFR